MPAGAAAKGNPGVRESGGSETGPIRSSPAGSRARCPGIDGIATGPCNQKSSPETGENPFQLRARPAIRGMPSESPSGFDRRFSPRDADQGPRRHNHAARQSQDRPEELLQQGFAGPADVDGPADADAGHQNEKKPPPLERAAVSLRESMIISPAKSAYCSEEALVPANLPLTTKSTMALPPRRFAPWMPPVTSPATYRPGMMLPSVSSTWVSSSILMPPMV